MLIHGHDKSGASFYTVTVAANIFSRGSKIAFLSGYPMAQEEFRKQVGKDFDAAKIVFYTKEHVSEFKEFMSNAENQDRIVVLKNIELFSEDVFDLVSSKKNIIISGDLGKCNFKEKIMNKKFATKIFFSPFDDAALPPLQKYEAFINFNSLEGTTRVAPN